MIKKLIALAATALFSLNASAGYVGYNLTGTESGTVIMDDTTKAVVFYSLADFQMQDAGDNYHRGSLISATTSFTGMGPTNMLLSNEYIEDYKTFGRIMFREDDKGQPNVFDYTVSIDIGRPEYPSWPAGYDGRRQYTGSGSATEFKVDEAAFVSMTEQSYFVPVNKILPYFDPNQVPEPASLALFTIGALGAAGAARRRKAAR